MPGCAEWSAVSMIELRKPNKLASQLLGEQAAEAGKAYRPITFCVLTEVDGVSVAYNSLTGELLELDEDEAGCLGSDTVAVTPKTEPLINKWFLVPVEHDDMKLSCELRELAAVLQRRDGLDYYVIYTTTDCNARCFYCYELTAKRAPMSAQVASDAAEFILRTRGKGKIHLLWYGGEPLYNAEAMDVISRALHDAGADFSSTMITNGYLFDDALAEKAKSLWKCRSAQITLDGTEEVYNKAKAYIYRDGRSPFGIVTDNIERLTRHGIRVAIRMNLGAHNRDDIYRLIDWIAERYPDRTGLHAYPYLLFDTETFDTERGMGEAERKAVRMKRARDLLDVEQYCRDKGLGFDSEVKDDVSVHRCMMDSPNAVTILPDGTLGKCDHLLKSDHVGSIYDGITDREKLAELAERWTDSALCGTCSAFPTCIRLRRCPAEGHVVCDEAKRMIAEADLRRRVEKTYRTAKEQLKSKAE